MYYRTPQTSWPLAVTLLVAASCSSDPTPSPSAGGAGTAGSTPTAGAPTAGAAGTSAGTGSTVGGQAGTAGQAGSGNVAGSSTAGTGGSGMSGAAGAAGSGGGAGGGAAGMGGGGAGGAGGAASCNGNAVSFNSNTAQGNDAAKARVEIPASSDLPTGNDNRTIEFWANVLSTSWSGDTNTMFFYGTNNRMADGFGLDFGGTKGAIDPFTNAIFDNDNQATGLDATKDQWVHFAMTWDGTAVRAFVNGVQKAMKTSSETQKTLMTGSTALIVGGYPPNFFNGAIDELRIWKVARSAADLTATMNKTLVGNEANLTGYYKFDETTGTTAADSVTTAGHTAHPGTLMGTQLPTWAPGVKLTCP